MANKYMEALTTLTMYTSPLRSEDVSTLRELIDRYEDCRNELCLKCGRYANAHLGACEGCRWEDGK